MWRFWIDVGGTFTDCLGVSPTGERLRQKVLSSGAVKGTLPARHAPDRFVDTARQGEPTGLWVDYDVEFFDVVGERCGTARVASFDGAAGELQLVARSAPQEAIPQTAVAYELTAHEPAPLLAIRSLLGVPLSDALPVVDVRLGTTRGTNALLTRQGARTALCTTAGFEDLLQIGDQSRRDLFALTIRKPEPLAERVITVSARMAADGSELTQLDEGDLRQQLQELQSQGIESLAICFLHADRYPEHERQAAAIADEFQFSNVSVSHRVSPLIKLLPRAQTTVLDAYLNPVLGNYVQQIQQRLGPGSRLKLMTSSGGLVGAEQFSGKDCLLSGPAGGVVGYARTAQAAGFSHAIGFDMGGTSTDVSRFDGAFEREYESEKAGVPISAPQLAIETVAAGGGSICHFDGTRLLVGPQSASSDPGPACYGAGGPLAITDVNLFLGRIQSERFPWRLDREAVQRRLDELREKVQAATGQQMTCEELASGFLKIANVSMATAIRSISIARGYDPADYVLCAFGGAAGQHACAVADELGMQRILIHPEGSLLSALGMGLADLERHQASGIYRPLSEVNEETCASVFRELEQQATEELLAEGVREEQIEHVRRYELRYRGTESTLLVEPGPAGFEGLESAFVTAHQRRFGYQQARPLELAAIRVQSIGRGEHLTASGASSSAIDAPQPGGRESSHTEIVGAKGKQQAEVWERSRLAIDQVVNGPALICESLSTTVVESGWSASRCADGQLLLTRERDVKAVAAEDDRANGRSTGPPAGHNADTNVDANADTNADAEADAVADPIRLELFNKHFQSIATEMGETLRQTAVSVNVKERLDFSCALFSPTGDLVANAPHIPVHLGAMSETVKSLLASAESLQPGDIYVSNDPFQGGSHLPDVTVMTPVFAADSGELIFFTASRAHHAELGGKTPGSMPPDSRNLAEEGVLIENFQLVRAGTPRWEDFEQLLRQAPYPSRNPLENLADVEAQVAANQKGVAGLLALVRRYSLPQVHAYMRHIQEAAARRVIQRSEELPVAASSWIDSLDDGTPIAVTFRRDTQRLMFDFTGSGPVHPGNLNANRSIVQAALMYVLRVWLAEDIPLNQGLLQAVQVNLPEGILNPPRGTSPETSPAMVGGNVETSQRIVDVLLAALDLAAASQGTMNNLLFGDDRFGYYETICGGSGASCRGPGADAVQTHMTNTRLTDPEILESRYPVRLHRFRIRAGSGGAGRFAGGNGIIRELEFLRPLHVSVLSQRRGEHRPFGMHGGEPGKSGRNRLLQQGQWRDLGSQASLRVEPHDRLIIETPGGGGWGPM